MKKQQKKKQKKDGTGYGDGPLGLSGEIVFKVVPFYQEDLNPPFNSL